MAPDRRRQTMKIQVECDVGQTKPSLVMFAGLAWLDWLAISSISIADRLHSSQFVQLQCRWHFMPALLHGDDILVY